MVIAALIFTFVKVVAKIVKISTGKATFKDKWFWIESGIVLLILFLIFSGAFFDFLEAVYTWTSKQDVVGKPTGLLSPNRMRYWG
ncbi:hypothetical protein D3C71_1976520 [compost metagenome]